MSTAKANEERGMLTSPERMKVIRRRILEQLAAAGGVKTEEQIRELLDADPKLWEALGDDDITPQELRAALEGQVRSGELVRGGNAKEPTFRIDDGAAETLTRSAAANEEAEAEQPKTGTPSAATPQPEQKQDAKLAAPAETKAAPPAPAKPDGKVARTFTREELLGYGLPLAPTKGVEVLSKRQVSVQGDAITSEVFFRLPGQPATEAWRATYRSSASLGDCETWDAEVVAQRVKQTTQTVVSFVVDGHEDEAPLAVVSVVKAAPAAEAKPAGEKPKKDEKPDPRFPRARTMEWSEDMTVEEVHEGFKLYRQLDRELQGCDDEEETAKREFKERKDEIEERRSRLRQQKDEVNDRIQNRRIKRKETCEERFDFAAKKMTYYRTLNGVQALVPQLTRPMTSEELALQPLFVETTSGWAAAGKPAPTPPAPGAPVPTVPSYDLTKAAVQLLREAAPKVDGKITAGAVTIDGRRAKLADQLKAAGLVILLPIAGTTSSTVKPTPAGLAYVAKLDGGQVVNPPLVTGKGPDVKPPVLQGDPSKPPPAPATNGAATPTPAAGKSKPKGGRSKGGRSPSARA